MLIPSTMDNTFVRQIMEYYREGKNELHIVFIDIRNTYDNYQHEYFGRYWRRIEYHINILIFLDMHVEILKKKN